MVTYGVTVTFGNAKNRDKTGCKVAHIYAKLFRKKQAKNKQNKQTKNEQNKHQTNKRKEQHQSKQNMFSERFIHTGLINVTHR